MASRWPQGGRRMSPKNDPKMAPRGPKRAPRWSKRAPEGPKRAPRGPKRPQVSPRMTHLDVKWRFPFLVLKGFSQGRFRLEKTIVFCISVNSAPRWRTNGKKTAPRGPKWAPRGPQEGPRGPQEGPKRAQDASQEGVSERMSYYLPIITY